MRSIYAEKPWLVHYKTAELPVPTPSLIDAFERIARRQPDAAAIYYFDRAISFTLL